MSLLGMTQKSICTTIGYPSIPSVHQNWSQFRNVIARVKTSGDARISTVDTDEQSRPRSSFCFDHSRRFPESIGTNIRALGYFWVHGTRYLRTRFWLHSFISSEHSPCLHVLRSICQCVFLSFVSICLNSMFSSIPDQLYANLPLITSE